MSCSYGVGEHITLCNRDEQRQSCFFSNRFGLALIKLPQGPRICGDYKIYITSEATAELEDALGFNILGRMVEFKNDSASKRTKNLFIEFKATSDGWEHSYKSGHVKGVDEGCILVISSGAECFVFNQIDFARFLLFTKRERCTTFRKNGNQPLSFTKGKIISVEDARSCASFVYSMTE